MQKAPSSLAFPEFSPADLQPSDDRIIAIAELIKKILVESLPKTNANIGLEIEGKLGKIEFMPDKFQPYGTELLKSIMAQKYWQVLFPQKSGQGGSYYRFESGVQSGSDSVLSESDIFGMLQQKLSAQSKQNADIQETYEKTQDVSMKHFRNPYN